MDNGLIFPYPQKSAHVEPSDAKCQKLKLPSGGIGGSRDPD
jgi:hypothetical protein